MLNILLHLCKEGEGGRERVTNLVQEMERLNLLPTPKTLDALLAHVFEKFLFFFFLSLLHFLSSLPTCPLFYPYLTPSPPFSSSPSNRAEYDPLQSFDESFGQKKKLNMADEYVNTYCSMTGKDEQGFLEGFFFFLWAKG